VSPDDPDYDESFNDVPSFKLHHDYVMSLHTFSASGMNHLGTHPDIIRFIFNSALYNAQSYMIQEYLFPLISNILPKEASRYSKTKSLHFKTTIEGAELEGNSVYETDTSHQDPLSNLYNNEDFVKVPTDIFEPTTPFPRGFYTGTDGPPSHPESTTGPGHGSQPPPTTGSQPPPQSSIPDDSGYTPDVNLAWSIRTRTTSVRARPNTDLRNDHMDRFKVTNEGPTSVANSATRPGDIILYGRTVFDPAYVVTYTRKSRKPIFNPITGRRR
jgi:hypothetical protein